MHAGRLADDADEPTTIAALGHDIGHMGVQNGFLINSNDPLALQYNDKSVLEQMHCSRLFSVLRQARLVDDAIFARTPRLGLWYERVRASEPTQRVLRGESPMGVLKQYYLPLGSAEICSLGDERGRWG